MTTSHRCAHCSRAIIAGDAYQCTRCNSVFHASCWASEPRCSCSSTTTRVVHVGAGGRVEVTSPPPPRAAGPPHHRPQSPDGYAGQRRPSQGGTSRMDPTAMGSDLDLECPHCMLPIDSLDEACPFCGRMPRFGKDVVVIGQGSGIPTPWGVQTIAMLDRFFAVFAFIIAAGCLIPLVAEAELGFLFASIFWASFGTLGWKMGGGLIKGEAWARTTQTVFSVLSLFGFPFFTVVGSLYLWGLHSDKADRFFEERPMLPEK